MSTPRKPHGKKKTFRSFDKKRQRQIELNAKDPNAWLGGTTIAEFAEADEPEYDDNGKITGLANPDSPEFKRIIAEVMAPYAHMTDDERVAAICAESLRVAAL